MDVLEGIRTRRSIHKYTSQPIEFEKLMAICEAGGLAPSSGNLQNWKFIVITDKNVIQNDIFHACLDQDCVSSAQAVIVICSDDDMLERQYGLRGKRLYAVQNSAAAAQNMLLTAHALGLGSTWIGAFNEERLKSLLDVPENARPQVVLTFGYPDQAPDEKRLRHIDDIVSFNVYQGRFKDMHRVFHDLSVEWQKQAQQAKETYKEPAQEIMNKCKDFLMKSRGFFQDQVDKVKDKGKEGNQ